MVTQTPSELAELVVFPSSCPDMAPSTWGNCQHWESQFRWGRQSRELSHSPHPSTTGMRDRVSTFPQNFSGILAVTVGMTLLPLLLKLVPSPYTGVTGIRIRTFRWCQREIRLFSASRALSEYYHIKTSQPKEMWFEQEQTPGSPIQECQSTTWCTLEILRYCHSVLWLTLEAFCRSRTKITGVTSWITLLWGKHRSWHQSSFNQIKLCESYFNWILVFFFNSLLCKHEINHCIHAIPMTSE